MSHSVRHFLVLSAVLLSACSVAPDQGDSSMSSVSASSPSSLATIPRLDGGVELRDGMWGWKYYENAGYGFSVGFPPIVTKAEIGRSQLNELFSLSANNVEDFNCLDSLGNCGYSVFVVRVWPRGKSVESATRGPDADVAPGETVTYEKVTYGDVEFRVSSPYTLSNGEKARSAFVEHGAYTYQLYYARGPGGDYPSENNVEQFLRSLTFASEPSSASSRPSAAGTTYRNDEYAFSFIVPKEYADFDVRETRQGGPFFMVSTGDRSGYPECPEKYPCFCSLAQVSVWPIGTRAKEDVVDMHDVNVPQKEVTFSTVLIGGKQGRMSNEYVVGQEGSRGRTALVDSGDYTYELTFGSCGYGGSLNQGIIDGVLSSFKFL